MASNAPRPKLDVREACLRQAAEIIGSEGVARLSLREVSRRLAISHQAPYKHFASREALLAEVIGRAFDDFTRFLKDRIADAPAVDELPTLGLAYLDYARQFPLQYRLMMDTPMPELDRYPGLQAKATTAFALLLDIIARVRGEEPGEVSRALALFAWSTVHGLASISANGAMSSIGLIDPQSQHDATMLAMGRICSGVGHPGGFPIGNKLASPVIGRNR